MSECGAGMSNGRVVARFLESAAREENLMAPGEKAMSAGVIAFDCQGSLKKRARLRRPRRHRQENVGKCAQNEVISVQVFRTFAFDALDLSFTQARFDRADDVQGDFVLESKNIIERAIVFFGPNMNAGFGLDQLAGNAHARSRFTHAAFEHISNAEFVTYPVHADRLTFVNEAGIACDDEKPLYTREAGDDVLDHSVGKILLLGVPA